MACGYAMGKPAGVPPPGRAIVLAGEPGEVIMLAHRHLSVLVFGLLLVGPAS